MIRIRYQSGIGIGESKRVVHAAEVTSTGIFRTLCSREMHPEHVERIDVGGAPCMQCTARAALATRHIGGVLSEPDQAGHERLPR